MTRFVKLLWIDKAKLPMGETNRQLIRAMFLEIAVSGAPKIRAMQIISKLEGRKRGLSAGCVNSFCFSV